jgi:hypothetical protein
LVDSVKVFYCLEEGAVVAVSAKGAQRRRDDHDAFGAGPIEDIISDVAILIDCVNSTIVLIGRQKLAAIGPKLSRNYSWSLEFRARARERTAINGISIPVDLPDDAVLSRNDQVVPKCAHVVERKRGVIRCVG